MKKIILSLLIIMVFFTITSAQHATATATAKVVSALVITNNGNLNFGSFVANNSTGGTVVLDPANSSRRNLAAVGEAPVLVSGGGEAVAKFTLGGPAEAKVNIAFSQTPVILKGPLGKTMEITGFSWNGINGVTPIPVEEQMLINVGATLEVGPLIDNPRGSYSGTFNVTATYE